MDRALGLLIFLFFINLNLYSQFEDYEAKNIFNKKQKKDSVVQNKNFVYGGDFGLQLGTNTLIKFSPAIAKYFTEYFIIGVSGTYIYHSNKFYNTQGNVWGGSFFAEVFPLQFIVLHSEYEKLYVDFNYLTNTYWTDSYLVGLGYRQTLGKKGMINYLIMWDFNYSSNSIYSNPRFKILILF